MNILQDFFKRAVAAQDAVAGEDLVYRRPSTQQQWSARGILTSRDGSATAQSGGLLVSITAHVLVPHNSVYTPAVGDRITSGGQVYMICSVISSPNDAAWSCDLINVQA